MGPVIPILSCQYRRAEFAPHDAEYLMSSRVFLGVRRVCNGHVCDWLKDMVRDGDMTPLEASGKTLAYELEPIHGWAD